jgi:hypothetical protein
MMNNSIYYLRNMLFHFILLSIFHRRLLPTIEIGSLWPPIGIHVGLTSNCPQIEGNNHPASLRVTCGQQVESPSSYWLFRWELPLQIKFLTMLGWEWSLIWPKIPSYSENQTSTASRNMSWNPHVLRYKPINFTIKPYKLTCC